MFRARRHFSLLLGKTNRYTDGTNRNLDGADIPTDLYLEPLNDQTKQDAYPARTGHWQPVVAGQPSRYRGNVVVNGAGVVGSTVASLFALRGWHVTILEQEKAAAGADPSSTDEPLSNFGPQKNFEVALMTKRGMDVLHNVGIKHADIASIGTKVHGVIDHSSSVSSLLTYGLSELQNFSLNNVVVDMHALRQRLHTQLQRIPHQNSKIFFEHKAVAHLPEQKVVVVKPLALDRPPESSEHWNTEEKAVMLKGVKFDEYVEGIEYDFLIGADGRQSSLRNMMQLDDSQCSNRHFTEAWFVVQGSPLDPHCIHRWLQRCASEDNPEKELGCIIAYPKGEQGHFAVQVFLPKSISDYYFGDDVGKKKPVNLEKETNKSDAKKSVVETDTNNNNSTTSVSDDDEPISVDSSSFLHPLNRIDQFIKRWCPQLKGQCMEGTISKPKPAPGLYLDHFYNYHNPFPNTVLVGDAAHSCHPFLMQGLPAALEDCASAINILDSRGRSSYDSIRQFSSERGVASDRLRNVTDRALYYHEKKHINPYLRFAQFYGQFMHVFLPRSWNEQYQGHSNYRYPRSIEAMMNGRGYASYEEIDAAQTRSNRFYCMMRLYA